MANAARTGNCKQHTHTMRAPEPQQREGGCNAAPVCDATQIDRGPCPGTAGFGAEAPCGQRTSLHLVIIVACSRRTFSTCDTAARTLWAGRAQHGMRAQCAAHPFHQQSSTIAEALAGVDVAQKHDGHPALEL
eukprot:7388938-Prymnesium_polylepis.2